jgi:cation transport regulator ChaC
VAGSDFWIFGYGSLIWRPSFPFVERRPGFIVGYERRFWQGSTDHRGVPGAPGRVVTLVPEPDALCWGVAYRLEAAEREDVLSHLDFREKGGYERSEIVFHTNGRSDASVRALLYVATPENPDYLGPAPTDEIAEQVRRSAGPSGPNTEYVLRLAEFLHEVGAEEPHVLELARLIDG